MAEGNVLQLRNSFKASDEPRRQQRPEGWFRLPKYLLDFLFPELLAVWGQMGRCVVMQLAGCRVVAHTVFVTSSTLVVDRPDASRLLFGIERISA